MPALVGTALAGFTVVADEKIDATKLIGKWEPVEVKEKCAKIVFEFKEQRN